MSMSINGMHNNALATFHQQRPVKDVSQGPANKMLGPPDAIGNNASNLHGSIRNEGVNNAAADQAMNGNLASLRVHQAVSKFHESASNIRSDIGSNLTAVRENMSGLIDQVRESKNSVAAERLGAMIDDTKLKMASVKDGAAEKIQMHASDFASRLNEMRAGMNDKYAAKTEQMTARADAAIEQATAAGNDERVTHIQEHLADALAGLDEKASALNARFDALEVRFSGDVVDDVIVAEGETPVDVEPVISDVVADAETDVVPSDVAEDTVIADDMTDAGQTDTAQTDEEAVA